MTNQTDTLAALLSKARSGDKSSMQTLIDAYCPAAEILLRHLWSQRLLHAAGSSKFRLAAIDLLEKLVQLDLRDTTVEKPG